MLEIFGQIKRPLVSFLYSLVQWAIIETILRSVNETGSGLQWQTKSVEFASHFFAFCYAVRAKRVLVFALQFSSFHETNMGFDYYSFGSTMKPRLIRTLVITDSFLSPAPYNFLKINPLNHLVPRAFSSRENPWTVCNTDTFSGPNSVRNNGDGL